METAVIIAIVALTGTIINSIITFASKIRKSTCCNYEVFGCDTGINDIQLQLDSSGHLEDITIPRN